MPGIGIVGAGAMGAGLATLAARRGIDVLWHDQDSEVMARALAHVKRDVQRLVDKNKLDPAERDTAMARLRVVDTLDELSACDLIIETLVESMSRKRALLTKLDREAGDKVVLASHTACLSITALASATTRPERVVGMHFFSPPSSMKLVEVVPGLRTEEAAVDTAMRAAQELGKTAIRVANRPGFLVERITRPFFGEALRMLDDRTAPIKAIDELMRAMGFRRGPFEQLDAVGIDTNLTANIALFDATFGDPRFRPHPLQAEMVAGGRLGRKAGRGFYEYAEE